jgi:hypothetical protein
MATKYLITAWRSVLQRTAISKLSRLACAGFLFNRHQYGPRVYVLLNFFDIRVTRMPNTEVPRDSIEQHQQQRYLVFCQQTDLQVKLGAFFRLRLHAVLTDQDKCGQENSLA